MNLWRAIGIGSAILIGGGLAFGFGSHRSGMRDAAKAYSQLKVQSEHPVPRYDQMMVSGLPEIAQRYFRHAIAPGTPLYSVAELEMEGTFLLGDNDDPQIYSMSARQILRAPQFVWIPRLRSGVLTINGSDALVAGEAWTHFWLHGLLPFAQATSSPDLVRSAEFRGAVEGALWLPPTLLPDHGARWEQIGADRARVTLTRFNPAIVLHMEIDQRGAVREVYGQRWSNANREQRFRLQPFGGTNHGEATFQGLTIPSEISVGNHFGTEEYVGSSRHGSRAPITRERRCSRQKGRDDDGGS